MDKHKPKFIQTKNITTGNLIGSVHSCLRKNGLLIEAVEFKHKTKKVKNWEDVKILINEYVEVIQNGE